MTTLGLLRHGPTAWNREKRIQGGQDIPLDRQAFDPSPWRQLLAAYGPWDHVVTSPLSRAFETAEILFPALSLQTDPGLREQDWGQWTGRTIAGLRRTSPGLVENQEARGWDFTPPEGESRRSVLQRALAAIDNAARGRDGQRVLLVTHFGVIMAVLNHLQGTTFLPETSTRITKRALHLLGWDQTGLCLLTANLRPT